MTPDRKAHQCLKTQKSPFRPVYPFLTRRIEVTETPKIMPSNQVLIHAQATDSITIQTEHATSLGIIRYSGLCLRE